MRNGLSFLLVILLALACASPALQAAPFFTVFDGQLDLAIGTHLDGVELPVPFFAFSGAATLSVNDPAFLDFARIEPFIDTAVSIGFDPTFTQAVLFPHDFLSAVFSPDFSQLFIPVEGQPFTVITNPALLALQGPWVFGYQFSREFSEDFPRVGEVSGAVYQLVSGQGQQVPEPASFALAGLGLVAVFLARRRGRITNLRTRR